MNASTALDVAHPAERDRRQARRRHEEWEAIRAARAFYGRPLEPDDLRRIRAARRMEEAVGDLSAENSGITRWPGPRKAKRGLLLLRNEDRAGAA